MKIDVKEERKIDFRVFSLFKPRFLDISPLTVSDKITTKKVNTRKLNYCLDLLEKNDKITENKKLSKLKKISHFAFVGVEASFIAGVIFTNNTILFISSLLAAGIIYPIFLYVIEQKYKNFNDENK